MKHIITKIALFSTICNLILEFEFEFIQHFNLKQYNTTLYTAVTCQHHFAAIPIKICKYIGRFKEMLKGNAGSAILIISQSHFLNTFVFVR